MRRTVGWFSCGAASALACKIAKVDVWAYCDTGAEHEDNRRFMKEIEAAWGVEIEILKSKKYADTWAVWEARRYMAGVKGAPCTFELKVKPRLDFQRPDDLHVFGYTADPLDRIRYDALRERYPELDTRAPLIEHGMTKSRCLGVFQEIGIAPPITYGLGFPNANCIPCSKSQSPNYWALIRLHFPPVFWRAAKLSRRLGVRLVRIHGERKFIDEIPPDWPTTMPIVPDCDLLCQLYTEEVTE